MILVEMGEHFEALQDLLGRIALPGQPAGHRARIHVQCLCHCLPAPMQRLERASDGRGVVVDGRGVVVETSQGPIDAGLVVLGSTNVILPEDLPEALLEKPASPSGSPATRYHEGVLEAKKQIILKAMEQAGGQYTDAARLLGVHPNYLHRLMRNLNLKGGD